MIRVKKVLNNNCILVEEDGEEKVFMGRGIGFNNPKFSIIQNKEYVEKIYVLQKTI